MVPSRAKAPEQSGALLLRMRVRIVRTVTRLCAFQDGCAESPGFSSGSDEVGTSCGAHLAIICWAASP